MIKLFLNGITIYIGYAYLLKVVLLVAVPVLTLGGYKIERRQF